MPYLFDKERIEDVLTTFQGYMTQVCEDDSDDFVYLDEEYTVQSTTICAFDFKAMFEEDEGHDQI